MNQRIERVRIRIRRHQLDALLVSFPANLRYLFGFSGSSATALISQDSCHFITDRRYEIQSQQQVTDAEVIIAQSTLHSEFARFKNYLSQKRVGIEAEHLNLREYQLIRKQLPDTRLVASEKVVESISAIKSAEEIAFIEAAADICRRIFPGILELLKPGLSELDISAEISYRAMRNGSEKDPFEPIVASGLRSALPHGISSSKKLAAGDLIVIDFGAMVNGYAADFTRTAILGNPTPSQAGIARAVNQALQAAEAAARPGITGRDLDKVARVELAAHGYAGFFKHSLGHGLGLNVHELPRVGEMSDDPIMAGNVITLEPGVYVPEVGGVRIEDDFVITQEKPRNLTPVSRELVSVG